MQLFNSDTHRLHLIYCCSIRLWSKFLEMHGELKRWTQTWRKCPLVTHSLHQPNREGFMCELIVECFFVCPLLCGLFLFNQNLWVEDEPLTRDAFHLSSQLNRLWLYLYSMRQRIITFWRAAHVSAFETRAPRTAGFQEKTVTVWPLTENTTIHIP